MTRKTFRFNLSPFVWLDAIHYKIKDSGKYVSKAVYTVLGVNMDYKKDILRLYLSESEGANFWLSVLTDLKPVYQAVSKEIAEQELEKLDEKWGKLYPIVIQSWQNKWENLSVYFLKESASTRNIH